MNTLSGTFRFVVLGLIVIVAAGCCCLPFIPSIASYSVEIGNQQRGPKYVPWKDKGRFDDALAQVRSNPNGKICICVLESPQATPYPHKLNNDCHAHVCASENIRTVKVTKSKAADEIAAGESSANDPNVMHRIQSPDPGDIKKVLDALATPTPIPTH
ncbi:MAG TPA: hypothetical protein VFS68_12020 [Candidatus Udaeobacter sp.]|nr:hypothetical protein [Candidatus Udaeobacter sp.]